MAWTDILSGVPGGGWGAAGTGLAAIADIYSQIQQREQYERQQRIAKMLSDPNKLAAYASQLYQGLSPAASAATSRGLNANLAMRGMGGGGGATNQYVADAFAKIESDRQMAAMQQAIAGLSGAKVPGGSGSFLTPQMLKVLFELQRAGVFGKKTGDGTTAPAAVSPEAYSDLYGYETAPAESFIPFSPTATAPRGND